MASATARGEQHGAATDWRDHKVGETAEEQSVTFEVALAPRRRFVVPQVWYACLRRRAARA